LLFPPCLFISSKPGHSPNIHPTWRTKTPAITHRAIDQPSYFVSAPADVSVSSNSRTFVEAEKVPSLKT
jgi:hypothetical protein